MERFSFSGLWKHAGSSYISAGIVAADATLSYMNVIAIPTWAHVLVGLAATGLAFYRGKQKTP